jgi:hypothetical protein
LFHGINYNILRRSRNNVTKSKFNTKGVTELVGSGGVIGSSLIIVTVKEVFETNAKKAFA